MHGRQLSCASPVALRGGPYSATVAPGAGGRLASLVWTDGEVTCPLLVGWDGEPFDANHWPKAGAFPMLPFANRLPGDGFLFEGRRFRPEPGPAGYPLHGFAHRQSWEIVRTFSNSVLMRCAHDPTEPGWPWAWSATLEVCLQEAGATVELRVRNESPEPMPLSMGWHPYHPAPPQLLPNDLEFAATHRHELDARGAASATRLEPLPWTQRGETVAFSRWRGHARIRIPGGTLNVRTKGAEHLIVHRPSSGNYVCVEPVTSLPGQLADSVPLESGDENCLIWSCGIDRPAGVRENVEVANSGPLSFG